MKGNDPEVWRWQSGFEQVKVSKEICLKVFFLITLRYHRVYFAIIEDIDKT